MNKLPLFHKGKTGSIHFSSTKQMSSFWLLLLFLFFVVATFVILGLRLFQLTVVKGDHYRRLAESNRIREIVIEAKRGDIIDRKGFLIAKSVLSPLTSDKRIGSRRVYIEPQAFSSIIGYLQIADKQDFKDDICLSKLQLGDKTGKRGIEKLFECDLRGKIGKKLVEVDAIGKPLSTLTVIAPQPGKSIQLSLDLELQKKAYDLIKDKKAAVIASDPQTGEILALVSTPSFNPQDFEDQNIEAIKSYLTSPGHPLFNRVTEGTYPPGSTFKIPVAVGALEEKKITERTLIEDTGTIKAGPLSFGNWYYLEYGKTEGLIDIVKGIKRSNDIFFYKTGEFMGAENIKKWASFFGLGKKSGIGIDEADGLIPSPFWKEEVLGEQWYLGDTYNLSIGQGYVLSTPLQVNRATAVIASNGQLCRPLFLKGGEIDCKSVPISQKTLSLIQEGMRQACATGGTGWPLFDFGIPEPFTPDLNPKASSTSAHIIKKRPISVSCKTGTAESHGQSGTPHAWFTAYAPSKNPEIVITVLVEESGQGSDIGGPIARDLLKAYFERSQ